MSVHAATEHVVMSNLESAALGAVTIFASAAIGSFLGVCYSRTVGSRGKTNWRGVIFGRSECDLCGRRLEPSELIPIVSWAIARGRCRCGISLTTDMLVFEVVAIGLILSVIYATDDPASGIIIGILGAVLFTLAAIDLRTHVLPDPLVGSVTALGLLACAVDVTPHDWTTGALTGTATAVILLGLRAVVSWSRGREALGLGDVKLASAGAIIAGPALVPSMILLACVIAMAQFAISYLLAGGKRKWSRSRRIPFGPALAIGIFVVALLGSPIGMGGIR